MCFQYMLIINSKELKYKMADKVSLFWYNFVLQAPRGDVIACFANIAMISKLQTDVPHGTKAAFINQYIVA